MKIKNGIHKDISIDQYHDNKTHYSTSGLKFAAKSMKHFWYYKQGMFEQTRKSHFDFGNAVECSILEPDKFDDVVGVLPDFEYINEALSVNPKLKNPRASKVYKNLTDVFMIENKDKYIINDKGTTESLEVIEHILNEVYANKLVQKLIKNIDFQNSCFWTDKKTGINLKTRPDICKINQEIIVDLKCVRSTGPEDFNKTCANNNYFLQAIMQIEGVIKSGLMKDVKAYYWLVVEKDPPYNVTLYRFHKGDWEPMRDYFKFILHKVKGSADKDFYPGYSERSSNKWGILDVKVPTWYAKNLDSYMENIEIPIT